MPGSPPAKTDSTGKQEDKTPKASFIFYVGIENQQTGTIQLDATNPPMNSVRSEWLTKFFALSGVTELANLVAFDWNYYIKWKDTIYRRLFNCIPWRLVWGLWTIRENSSKVLFLGKKSTKGTYFSGINLREVWQVEKHLRLILPKGSRRAQLENIIHPESSVYVLQRFKTAPFQVLPNLTPIIKKKKKKREREREKEKSSSHKSLCLDGSFFYLTSEEALPSDIRFAQCPLRFGHAC